MKHREQRDLQRMEELILEAVRHILRHRDLDRFLTWAKERIPEALGVDDDFSIDDERRLATLLGLGIWNALPRPDNDFRPLPAPQPEERDPCPCGSREAFGDCCAHAGDVPELPAELFWELLLDELPEAEVQRALRCGMVPEPLLAKVADRWLGIDRPGRAVALLEPLFQGDDLTRLDAAFEPALDVLCDAYDALDHWKKKQTFLLRVTEVGSRPLKAAAWQRLSIMFIDESEFEYAFEAFEQAQRYGPESPGTALLEITLLAAQHRDDHARSRALFWRHKLRRAGVDGAGIMEFLERAAIDPQEALVASQAEAMDPLLLDLRAWIEGIDERPPAALEVTALPDPLDSVDTRQLPLFDELPLPRGVRGSGAFGTLRAGRELRRLEHAWHLAFEAEKPASTALSGIGVEAVWEQDNWLRLLQAHPECSDSLDILDDIATALYEHPDSSLPWIAHVLLLPLLERAERIIRLSVRDSGVQCLPWSDLRNRPALRLLFRLYLQLAESSERRRAVEVLELLLALNPRDNHGVRAELMNYYLRGREDEKALALARQFPTDALADLAYGEVLALYRLGEQERAERVLHQAVDRLPRIPRFLLRKRVKRPALSAGGFTPGGDDQAWLYRQAMRDVWEAEPGLLAWMKNLTA
ncbi:MAG: SEC-C domain-containing protein [Thiohalocapsa sp.]|nr:SEC-C domain-containing protein [Thiohalocapsa sp.]